MLKIYNTLTQKKEPFKPIHPGVVDMYVCGPTVYNYIHVGNARSIIAFDTVRRYFQYLGYHVNYVSNFTDVDDKMIKEARQEHTTVPKLADKYIKAFYQDIDALNVERATKNPRATHNIPDIINFIKVLVNKGFAYESNGSVYYRVKKFPTYGALAHESLDSLESGASQHVTSQELSQKENPLDFALWKKAKPGEIHWQSPWGAGRPGWHIECSVMATKYLGDTIDIHGGGEDLAFPHHENERAQSEAKTGKTFVHYWMHNGFVTIGKDNEKMSKSLHNFVMVHDLVKHVDPQVIRFLMSTTQYRRPIQYSDDSLQEAASNLNKLRAAYNNLNYRLKGADAGLDSNVQQKVEQIEQHFKAAMNDDFNVQNGIAEVYKLAKLSNVYVSRSAVTKDTIKLLLNELVKLSSIFGIKYQAQKLNDDRIKALIQKRADARKHRDFKLSDQIRDDLKAKGIILEDTPQGTRFRRE
ncbi:MAG: cysteine--tRNA ligase [Acetilactobacillus jinshanensis]